MLVGFDEVEMTTACDVVDLIGIEATLRAENSDEVVIVVESGTGAGSFSAPTQ